MARHERRASLAAFRKDAMRRDVETFLIESGDTGLLRSPFFQAILHWRSHAASRKPRCAAACGTTFAADDMPGGWLFAQPTGSNAVSVSAFCAKCWSGLSDAGLELVAMRVLKKIKPNGARFADAPSDGDV
jgi:hypothetical protein